MYNKRVAVRVCSLEARSNGWETRERLNGYSKRLFLSMIDEMMMCHLYGSEIPPCELSVLACVHVVCTCASVQGLWWPYAP